MSNNLEYDQWGDYWWSTNNILHYLNQTRSKYFHAILGDIKNLKVLDIGCGGGLLSEEFAKKGAEVAGIDISEKAISVAGTHALKNNLNINYKVGIAENLPFDDKTFDIVACVDCLEHVSDSEKTINEISRVLKINGKFLYLTHNRTLVSKIIMVWAAKIVTRFMMKQSFKNSKMPAEYFDDVHDWRKFIKPEELHNLISKYGMKNVETKGVEIGGPRDMLRIGENVQMTYIGYAKKH